MKIIQFPAQSPAVAQKAPPAALSMSREEVISQLKASLKARSKTPWSVTGGTGTAYGWIKIKAAPRFCTWGNRAPNQNPGRDGWEAYDTGKTGRSMSPAHREELRILLGWESQQEYASIPPQTDYRQEYLDRAAGRAPAVTGKPDWD